MIDNSKVSIIIALYNTENYIEKCIESVIHQTYKNIEIVIVDDGSTDDSLLKCKKYTSDIRIKLIHKDNGGLSTARQIGFENSTGAYVCFIDADDYLQSEYVEKMANRLINTGSDICLCYSRYIHRSKEWIVGYNLKEDKYIVTSENLKKHYHDQCGMFMMSDSWNKMYRAEFIKSTEVKFELPPKMNGTDLAFNHKLAMHCPRYTTISDVLYNHLLLENSAVRRKGKKLLNSYNTIMYQLLNEANKLNITQLISDQLKTIYIRFLRDGLVDSTLEASNLTEIKDNASNAYIFYKQMCNDYPILKKANYIGYSKSLDIFNWCLGNVLLMSIYLSLYKLLKNI